MIRSYTSILCAVLVYVGVVLAKRCVIIEHVTPDIQVQWYLTMVIRDSVQALTKGKRYLLICDTND
ncbi:hypothetical protein D1872_176130 [compost metagenome]